MLHEAIQKTKVARFMDHGVHAIFWASCFYKLL